MERIVEKVIGLRKHYNTVCRSLPWLDGWVAPDMTPAFDGAPLTPKTEYVKIALLESNDNADLLLWRGAIPTEDEKRRNIGNAGKPVILRSDEIKLDDLDAFLTEFPNQKMILATGERKILYYIAQIRELMLKHHNLYLNTANLCNWDAIERMVAGRLCKKLLYGSFLPLWDPATTRGPLVLSRVDWKQKCDIAGNNLRELLGRQPVVVKEPESRLALEPFIIDSHAHAALTAAALPFEAYVGLGWEEWRNFLDAVGVENMLITPNEAIHTAELSSATMENGIVEASGGRISFYEVFDPRDVAKSAAFLEAALRRKDCIGIKLHPAGHEVMADDDRYSVAFEFARRFGKPIMSHTWAISSYNPKQRFSCPELFERWLKEFPDVTFVFGHAGGRPESFGEIVRLLNAYPQTCVDIAGDYFHNGMIDNLIKKVGASRILFASDVNWIDPRCQMGQLLESAATDNELALIFRENAKRIFNFSCSTRTSGIEV